MRRGRPRLRSGDDAASAEAPRALGITSDGAVLELFTAGEGETWTITVTLPNGKSRIIATGEHWVTRPMLAKGRVS